VANPPVLSIVLTGRNDDWHGGDFNERFLRTLAFNHDRLTEREIPHEIVLVEWNPVPDRPPLAELAATAFPELAGGVLVSYIVDRRFHDAVTLNPNLQYLQFVAKNVGIRRATGDFILSTNADVLLGRHVIDVFAGRQLEPRTVYRAARVDIQLGADPGHWDWAFLEDARNYARRPVLKPPLYAGGTGDFVLLDRISMHDVRGFNEVYRLASVGVDYNFLVKAHANGLRLVDIGGPVYHPNHVGSFRLSKGIDSPERSHFGDYRWHSRNVIYHNPDAWGLANAPVHPAGHGAFQLEFDWSAVPPLLDLRGVVLPGERVGQVRP